MKRINDNEISMTNAELDNIKDFIRGTLAREWDDYTSRFYGIKESHEQGMRKMDSEMYDIANEMTML